MSPVTVTTHDGVPLLAGKVIVVTGGGGLLGRAFVHRIVEDGGHAVAADIDLTAATSTATGASTDASGGTAIAMAMDITDPDSVQRVIAEVSARYGRIDAVVNNAYPRNAAYGRKLEDVTYRDFSDNLARHVGGYFLVAQQFAMLFRAQRHGTIVNMGSIYGALAPRFGVYDGTTITMPVEYAAIKSAVIQLTRYFAQYFKADGIRVNTLSPGGIRDRQPDSFIAAYAGYAGTKGLLDATDVCGALVFLLSDDAKYVTGQNLIVDDGFAL